MNAWSHTSQTPFCQNLHRTSSLRTNPSRQNQTHPCPTTHRQIAVTQILYTQNRPRISLFTYMSTMQLSRPYHPTPLLLPKHHNHMNSPGFVRRPCGGSCAASAVGWRSGDSRRRSGVQPDVRLDGPSSEWVSRDRVLAHCDFVIITCVMIIYLMEVQIGNSLLWSTRL